MKRLFRHRHVKGLLYSVSLLALVSATGTVGYHEIGAPTATWVDSFYMMFITVATIGYGEVVDLSAHPAGRLFTVVLATIGIATVSYLFSTVVALLVDADLNAEWKRKRMEKQMAELRGHYIMCGIGRVGSNVARELLKTRRKFVVIEKERSALDSWLEHHPHALYLHEDAADDDALRKAGLAHAAGVFAVTGDDGHNLMIALSVKLLNPKVRVVVRVHDVRNTDKARRAGADEIVSPDFTGGMRIASAMVRPHVVSFMDQMLHSDESLRVEEVVVPKDFSPTALGDLVPRSPDYLLVATHERGRWVFNPSAEHVIQPGAALVLMASPDGVEQVRRLLKT